MRTTTVPKGSGFRFSRIKLAALTLVAALAAPVWAGEGIVLEIDPQAIAEILPLAVEAVSIQQRAVEREAKHAAELRKKGIAEVPPCGSERYVIDTPAFGGFSFDDWGELYIDRRFVTDEEMKTVRKIEAWIVKWFPKQTEKRKTKPRVRAGGAGLPVFRGFEDARYQEHDALIARLVKEFGARRAYRAACEGVQRRQEGLDRRNGVSGGESRRSHAGARKGAHDRGVRR